MFSSERAVKEFVQKDRNFAQRVLDHIKSIIADIKNIFNKLVASGNYDEISAWQSDMEALDKLNNMMLDALAEIEHTNSQTQKNTSEEVKNSKKRNPAQSKYESDVDAVINGTYNSRSALIMGVTPQIYQELGFSKLPIAITKNHVYSIAVTEQQAKADGRYNKKVNYHGLGAQAVKDIYQNISDPIMVIASPDFQSKTQRESVHKVIAVVDLQVGGKQVIAHIEIDAEVTNGKQIIDVNLVSSYFEKSNLNKMLSEAVAQESTGDVGFYYVDKNRAKSIFKLAKVQYLGKLDSLNSNGIIHKIDEKVNRKIDSVLKSKQFIRWFGDWQNKPETASKIVNADGTPKVMYHGTQSSFTAFDKKKAKSSGYYGKGFYFTESESHAKQYGDSMAVYLDVKNPLEPGKNSISKKQLRKFLEAVAENEDYDIWNYGTEDISEIVDSIYKNDAFSVIQDINATAIGDFAEAIALFNKVNKTSYDGIVTPTETVVYEPIQIKSATDNIGTFDSDNDDIRFSSKRAETTAKNPNRLTENDVKRFMEDAINGNLHEGTYFPVRRNTPKILIESALNKNGDTIENLPIIIQVKKATAHGISSEDMIAIVKAMDDPQYIIYQEDNDRYVEVVKYDTSKGSKAVAVLEIGGNKDTPYLNGFEGGSYHTLVTAFKPDAGYVSDTLLNKKSNTVIYKKKGNSQRTSGSTVPSVLNELPFADSISENGNNVNTKFSMKSNPDHKQNQLDIINETNPAPNTYSTWIRTVDDIKTLAETLEDEDWEYEEINPDLTRTDIQNAIESGEITVYSSYPIKNGVFVSPSRMEAESYSGNGKVYEKTVDINDVAWIDPTQGQYAKVDDVKWSFKVTQDDINEYVENAYIKNNTEDYKKYAEPSDRLVEDLKGELNLDGYAHALRDNDIRHIRNSPGEQTNEKYPVTRDDIKQIPYIVQNYDKVYTKTNASGELGIVYVKVGLDNIVYYVEAVTSKYHNENLLVNKQMVKAGINEIPNLRGLIDAINKKESSSQYLADLQKIRKAYAQSVKENYSNNSIPNSEDAVKDSSKKRSTIRAYYLNTLKENKKFRDIIELLGKQGEILRDAGEKVSLNSKDIRKIAYDTLRKRKSKYDINEFEESLNTVYDYIENSGDLRTVYRGMSSNRRNGNGDVSVYSRPSSSGISRALLNCLQDCYERRRSVEEKQKFSTKRQSSVSEDASNYILDTKEYKEAMKLVDQWYRLTGKKKLDAKAIDRFAGRLLSKSQSQYSREQLTERLSALFDYIANSGTVIKKGLAHII